MKPALCAVTATKTVQAATVNKSLQFRSHLREFFAPVWGLPLVAVYVPVRDKIRSESFAVAANMSRRSGGAFILLKFSRHIQISNSIKVRPAVFEFLHADRQMELIFAFDNSANAHNINRGTSFYQRNKHSNSNAQKVCICRDIPRQLQC